MGHDMRLRTAICICGAILGGVIEITSLVRFLFYFIAGDHMGVMTQYQFIAGGYVILVACAIIDMIPRMARR